MSGSNGACDPELIVADKRVPPPPRFHDCDYVGARAEYEDFVTGFVTPDGNVWSRPGGITVARDGSLFFSEDGNIRSDG